MARPSKYTKETLKKAEEYIESCVDEIERVVKYESDKSTGYENNLKVKLPKAEGLALYLGVARSRLYEWAGKYKEFKDILERINQVQADRVINEALAGNYNPLIAKLLLGKHGYKEQSDITSGGKPIPLFNYVKNRNNIGNGKDKETEKEN